MKGNQILTEQGGLLFGNALETLETALGDMRRVAQSLIPEILLKFGLKDAIQTFCDGINQSGKMHVNLQLYGLESRLEQSLEITIYRIVQEHINYTLYHAEATKVLLQITKSNDNLILTVEDNGKGFDKKILDKKSGISNIESRVAYHNGTIAINTAPNEGTSVVIEFKILK